MTTYHFGTIITNAVMTLSQARHDTLQNHDHSRFIALDTAREMLIFNNVTIEHDIEAFYDTWYYVALGSDMTADYYGQPDMQLDAIEERKINQGGLV
jgi:hypothetical protein